MLERIWLLTDSGEEPLDLTQLSRDELEALGIDDNPTSHDPFARIPPRSLPTASSAFVPTVSEAEPFLGPDDIARMRAAAIAEKNQKYFALLADSAQSPVGQQTATTPATDSGGDNDMPGLTAQLYNYYLIPFGGGKDPQNPVLLHDWRGELKEALAGQMDIWYQNQVSQLGLGAHFFDVNAAANGSWYTGRSDYSGLGLLAHSANVRAVGSVIVRIARSPEGFQKAADFGRVQWTWNDQIHGMNAKEWERRYPGSRGWLSPEVWLHVMADWYGAYYVAIDWDDENVVYKGDIYGGEGSYEAAVNSGVSRVKIEANLNDQPAAGAGPSPRVLPP